ncbi:hypothetical protein AFIC_002514 [[Pseudomonas] carboxydohydrogena]|uniref:Uncharacterized protein n=2 Tax=Afipia carboxydohydrogena TaxID=290 RepID=A0ABY8BQI5_AFICR|nr:hypothetical protein [[Pseudomonas] carboxydohydrogena]WEF50955.1 hypothetical protein AFIC_002514 [[Pseudomonas] carboxydohydrogena]
MFRYRWLIALFAAVTLGYVALSFAMFQMPDTMADAENCGFLPGEFVAAGQLTYERSQAWWISFQRKDEIWIALSVGMAAAFIGFALSIGRRAGGGVATGAAMGGGVLALSAICVSCLAPVLSVVGLGLAGSLLAGLPKWLIALNTLMLTGWGALYLSRRGNSCPMPRSEPPIQPHSKTTEAEIGMLPKTFMFGVAILATALLMPQGVMATDYATVLQPAKPGLPLAHPIARTDIAPPPFSEIADRPVKPAYVPGLPGLPQGVMVKDDFGVPRPPKYDGVVIRKSRVENGEVVIPPGGLFYLEDTWGGEVALRGEPMPVLGRMPTYVDYDMSIVVKENVTIPAGKSVVVGGTVYQYYATVGHEKLANHALHVKTIAGTDWEWAFGSPVLSQTEPSWWGTRFTQLYNQGQAREVTPQKMVFDWISGIRMDRLLLADEKVFSGLASAGDEWKSGNRTVRVAAIDPSAGTVRIEVIEDGKVVLDRTLGPVKNELLIEDHDARKALVFEHGDVAGFLSPWPEPFKDGKANLKIYGKTFSLNYGQDYAADPRFSVYPVGCPTGHNFGFMLVNKDEIRLKPGAAFNGPEGYFKVAVDRIDGDKVTAWHVEDKKGNRSVNLGGAGVTNVDLVLGQGRVTGQAILKDVGRAMLTRTYQSIVEASGQTVAVNTGTKPATHEAARSSMVAGLSPGMIAGFGILLLGCLGVGYEVGRRRA